MSRIRDVWAPTLEQEMRNLRQAIDDYPYITMDTEFPGVVARPIGSFKTSSDYHYQTMRCNVDLLKIIQVGLTLADAEGRFPPEVSTWQFNFAFSVNEDMYSPDSIELLQNSGIDFQRHEEYGIQPNHFAELLITSGLVLAPETKWISFHSGYDFGYLLKLLTATPLPTSEDQFFQILSIYFPTLYDIKFMMRATKGLHGGLQNLADDLGVPRIGPAHQAGSDSLLTAATFFKMREIYFSSSQDKIDDKEYNLKLYGFGQTFSTLNGIVDPGRGGATLAEREDRAIAGASLGRDLHNQTPGTQNGAMQMGGMSAPVYAPMGANNTYLRTTVGAR